MWASLACYFGPLSSCCASFAACFVPWGISFISSNTAHVLGDGWSRAYNHLVLQVSGTNGRIFVFKHSFSPTGQGDHFSLLSGIKATCFRACAWQLDMSRSKSAWVTQLDESRSHKLQLAYMGSGDSTLVYLHSVLITIFICRTNGCNCELLYLYSELSEGGHL